MAAQWPVPDFLDAFKTQLEAVSGLSGVNVHTAPPGPDTDTSDRIILASGDLTGNTPWSAVGQLHRDDQFTIPCEIIAVRPGAGETVAKTARDRVETLFQLVLEEMKAPPQVGTQTIAVSDISYTLKQGPVEGMAGSRAALLEFQFTVTVRVT